MASCLVPLSILLICSFVGSFADNAPFIGDCVYHTDLFDPPTTYREIICNASSGIPIFPGNHQFIVKERLVLKGNITKIPTKAFAAFKSIKELSLQQTSAPEPVKAEFEDGAFTDTTIQKLGIANLAGVFPLPNAIKQMGKNMLQFLKIENCGEIINLDANQLAGFSYLMSLHIEYTPIVKIDDAAFSGLENSLKVLSLVSTALTKFPRKAVKSLANLQVLDLTRNEIDDFQSGDFAQFKSLTRLALNGNNLQVAVDSGSLNNLGESAVVMELNNGGLRAVPAQMLATNPQLTRISMINNKIKTVKDGDFLNNINLQYLYLGENPISIIEAGSLKILSKLEVLDLHKTKLRSFELSICNNMNRVSLDLTNIETLESVDVSAMDTPADQHGMASMYLSGTGIIKLDSRLGDTMNSEFFYNLFVGHVKNFICDEDADWMAKHVFCNPSRLDIEDTSCVNLGIPLKQYLKQNVPDPCSALLSHPKQVRKVGSGK